MCCPGVIDLHQEGTLAQGTSDLVLCRPELVRGQLVARWLDRFASGANF